MRFQLVAQTGDRTFDLPAGRRLSVGRALQCDVAVLDPTISRRHAELWVEADGLHLRDLGSSNGTFVNGRRVETAVAVADDVLTFGKVTFNLLELPDIVAPSDLFAGAGDDGERRPSAAATILRARPVPAPGAGVHRLRTTTGPAPAVAPVAEGAPTPAEPAAAATGAGRAGGVQRRLELLVAVAHALGRARDTDALLHDVVSMVFEILEADRAAVLLIDDQGDLRPVVAHDASGQALATPVPSSIARRAMDERVAILSDDAPEDQRFGGASIIAQQVRSAICAPLLGSDGAPIGVLYVDNRTLTHRYGDDDLDFVIAFAGLAGVALENSRFAERLRREALVRANFERYFAPALAERIASDPGTARLGGDRRPVAVLFSDIRDFTSLAESMRPDDVAALLTEYFTQMVECVFRHGGALDKFIGDAILAQWGAPIGGDDDADRALRAAVEMQRELASLNERWRARGRPELGVGMGLSYGDVFAGNIGSERRLEYTIIGDTVNVASRLSAAARAGEILVTDELRGALRSAPELEACAPLTLRGKSQPVPVYRVARR
ncbi:MAG: adenylate/guanylate cyclase domain-containing protein [Gemmatimonadaceae bacterium]